MGVGEVAGNGAAGAIREAGCTLRPLWPTAKRRAVGAGATYRSPGDVKLVEAAYALALDKSDPKGTERSIDAFIALMSDSVVFVPEGGETACQGRKAVKRLLADAAEQWQSLRYEVDEIIDLGGGDLIAWGKVLTRGENGRSSEIQYVNRWTIEAGRTVRIDSFRDCDEALESFGRRGTRASRAAHLASRAGL